MLKYGGVYCDTDAIFVRPLSSQLRAYDVVVSLDWPDWDHPFPEEVNLGVLVSKPGARFWELCLVSCFSVDTSSRYVSDCWKTNT